MKTSELYNLMFNPLWISKLLQFLISGALAKDRAGLKFELLYYALPFIFDESIERKLSQANTSSTFESTFRSAELRNALLNKVEGITSYAEITNCGLIYLSQYADISIGPRVSVTPTVHYRSEEDEFLRTKYKASYNWGVILGREDYLSVILKIGAYSS